MKTGSNCFGRVRSEQGFTRAELAAVLGAIALFAMVVLAASAATKSDSERVVCFNNLRMVGQAILAFEASHGGKVSWRTPLSEGGTLPYQGTKPGAAWYEFSVHSNYMASPRISPVLRIQGCSWRGPSANIGHPTSWATRPATF